MILTEMNKGQCCFGGDFEIFLIRILYKIQIIVLKKDSKCLILGTCTDKLYSSLGLGDPTVRRHPPYHLYVLFYYCPTNPYYTNMFNHYKYLAVEDRKRVNPFVGHVRIDKPIPYHYVKE